MPESPSTHGRRFLVAATGTLGVTLSGAAISFGTAVALGRWLGPAGYGAYTYSMTWAMLLALLAGMGLSKVVVRNVAMYVSTERWALARGMMRYAQGSVVVASLLLAGAVTVVIRVVDPAGGMSRPVMYAMALVPLLALTEQQAAALRGLHHIVSSAVPAKLVRPLVFLVVAACCVGLAGRLSAVSAVTCQIAAAAVALGLAVVLARRVTPPQVSGATAALEVRAWALAGVAMLMVAAMNVINKRTDVLMLGILAGARPTGIYQAGSRAADLVLFVARAANATSAPSIARAKAQEDHEALQRAVSHNVLFASLLGLGIGIALLVFGRPLLLLFGPGFAAAYGPMSVLVGFTLFNAACGPVGTTLVMTGHERVTAVVITCGALLNVALNAVFIPLWGPVGAALASGITMAGWNLAMLVAVRKLVDVRTSLFAALRLAANNRGKSR